MKKNRKSNKFFRSFYLFLVAFGLTHGAISSFGLEVEQDKEFEYFSEQFSDLRILRYQVPGFLELDLSQKRLLYYLSKAALSGRDIMWDQNYKHNLTIRKTLEEIVKKYKGNRDCENFRNFMIYVKRVWFSNGIHHHYSNDKILPQISTAYFMKILKETKSDEFPLLAGETNEQFTQRILPIIFDPNLDPKKVSLDTSKDLVENSAVNFYENILQHEVESYYDQLENPYPQTPISQGLNSKLIKENGSIYEKRYKLGGMYSDAIAKIIYWLKQAAPYSQSDLQRQSIEKLISYYTTGNLRDFDAYNIIWVKDTQPVVDFVNGFIEVYNDPLSYTGSWESVVSIKDLEATKKFGILSDEAAWFEENSPIDPLHKRESVTGVSYKIINVVMEAGDSSPSTPIGINLPNANWIRAEHGSKSVSLGNIEAAYSEAAKTSGVMEEFYLEENHAWIKKYGKIADKLSTGLHEVIGHASGRILPDVGTPAETLKSYASTLEEARADLVALYYIGDQHLVDIGLTPSVEVIKAEYIQYITNGLIKQLARLEEGNLLEESHMRNRHMISSWVLEHGKAAGTVEMLKKEGKTFIRINNFEKLRDLFGQLLKEVQRVKSEGDYEGGKNLVEQYGVRPDPILHKEVLERWKGLNLAPYSGFINPELKEVKSADGKVVDIEIVYPNNFTEQMLEYGKSYGYLPYYN